MLFAIFQPFLQILSHVGSEQVPSQFALEFCVARSQAIVSAARFISSVFGVTLRIASLFLLATTAARSIAEEG